MDWYRKKRWRKKDEEEFFLRLSKARKYNRAQYLRIQAVEFIDTRKPKLLTVSEQLLNQVLDEYPNEKIEISSTLHSLGEIYEMRKDYEKAMEYYKKAIDYEKDYPNVRTDAYLDYSKLVVKTKKIKCYDYSKELLMSKIDDLMFPVEKYEVASILSIIYKHENKEGLASKYAKIANESANANTSGLRYHKYLGLVKRRIRWLDRLVRKG